jgi:hypothetical protein
MGKRRKRLTMAKYATKYATLRAAVLGKSKIEVTATAPEVETVTEVTEEAEITENISVVIEEKIPEIKTEQPREVQSAPEPKSFKPKTVKKTATKKPATKRKPHTTKTKTTTSAI